METFFETHLNFEVIIYKGKTITVRNTAKLIQAMCLHTQVERKLTVLL